MISVRESLSSWVSEIHAREGDMAKRVHGPWLRCVHCGYTIWWTQDGHWSWCWFHTNGTRGCGLDGGSAEPEFGQQRLV